LKDDEALTIASVVKGVLMTGLVASIIISIFLSGTLSLLLGLINGLQLVFHLPIMNIIVPGNVSMFFEIMIPIVMFDLLSTIGFMTEWFPLSKSYYKAHNHGLDQISNIGYDSYNPVLNLGTIGFLLVLYLLRICSLLPIKCFNIFSLGIGRNFFTKTYNALFWGDFILIFINGYIEFLISAILAYKAPDGSPDDTDFVYGISIFSLTVSLVLIPILLLWMVACHSMKTLNSSRFQQKWGMLYDTV